MTFATLEYGPSYPATSITITQWQGMNVSILTENSNYQRLGT